MRLRAAWIVLAAALFAVPAAAQKVTEGEAHVYSAFVSGADHGVLARDVALGPALREELRGETDSRKIYDALIDRTPGRPLRVTGLTPSQAVDHASLPGVRVGEPMMRVEAGNVVLLVQYAAKQKNITFVERLGGEPKPAAEAPKPAAAEAPKPAAEPLKVEPPAPVAIPAPVPVPAPPPLPLIVAPTAVEKPEPAAAEAAPLAAPAPPPVAPAPVPPAAVIAPVPIIEKPLEDPKPAAAEAPKPEVVEAPKPPVAETPKPAATAAPKPKPAAAAAPKPKPAPAAPKPAPVAVQKAAPVAAVPARPAPAAPPRGECVIKPVMTDEDMRNCAVVSRSVPSGERAPVVVEPPAAGAAAIAAPAAKPRPDCVIKPVMTDEDLRNCAERQAPRALPAELTAVQKPAPSATAAAVAAPAAKPRPDCVIKPVMTEEELRNCSADRSPRALPADLTTIQKPAPAAPAPAAAATPKPRPDCVIKPVMTEEELRTCAADRTPRALPAELTTIQKPAPSAPAPAAATTPRPRPDCVIKPVMTDEELRACR